MAVAVTPEGEAREFSYSNWRATVRISLTRDALSSPYTLEACGDVPGRFLTSPLAPSRRSTLAVAKLDKPPRYWRFVLSAAAPKPARTGIGNGTSGKSPSSNSHITLMQGDRAKDAVVLAVFALEVRAAKLKGCFGNGLGGGASC
jgi:hypothetical protein